MWKGRRNGFTLLEVMLAICVMALVGLGIFRFVEAALAGTRTANASWQERVLSNAFAAYLRTQMLALPGARAGAISGEAHRFHGISCDELRWIARPGSGLLTRHAVGEWAVTLTVREMHGGAYELGLRRQDMQGRRDARWLPLFAGVRGFEVRYFDRARKEWMEKWTDLQTRPALIRVKLWRDPEPEAQEIVLPVVARGEGGGA